MSRAPRLILHLGQHKTGSKALQSFLAHHAPRLLRRGILYPLATPAPAERAYAISHHHLFALLRREALLADAASPDTVSTFWVREGRPCPAAGSPAAWLAAIERERAATGAHTVILSAEDLFDLHTAHELDFDRALPARAAATLAALVADLGWAAALVVYLRRPDHLLAAHYAQFVKGPAPAPASFAAFAAAFAPRLDAPAQLAPWAHAFGSDRLHVRPYERASLPHGIVPDFFANVLGFPVPADWPAPPDDPESANPTPARAHLELILRWKQRRLAGAGSLRLEDILADAFAVPAPARRGADAWLSPAERRALLARHAAGYAALASRFLPAGPPAFFAEPPPPDDPTWQPEPPPTAAVLRTMVRRIRARLPWRTRLRRTLSSLRTAIRRR